MSPFQAVFQRPKLPAGQLVGRDDKDTISTMGWGIDHSQISAGPRLARRDKAAIAPAYCFQRPRQRLNDLERLHAMAVNMRRAINVRMKSNPHANNSPLWPAINWPRACLVGTVNAAILPKWLNEARKHMGRTESGM
jgi:hypothetical protein